MRSAGLHPDIEHVRDLRQRQRGCADDGGHDFKFFWHDVNRAPDDKWKPQYRRALQAIRERTNELAILKTLGFSDSRILTLVLAESCLIAIVGGGRGQAVAWPIVSFIGLQIGFVAFETLPVKVKFTALLPPMSSVSLCLTRSDACASQAVACA